MKKTWNKMIGKFWIVLLALLVTGCQAKELAPTGTPEALFIPPTAGEDHEQNSEAPPAAPPTQQGNCVNQLRYLKDLTIPDGSEVLEGEKITKRWLITNEGSCNWDQSYSFQLISGLALGAKKYQLLYPARQGSKAILEISFTAPNNPGRYNSWWQAFDSSGKRFGDPLYMDISVISE
jgi:hypothetical protein